MHPAPRRLLPNSNFDERQRWNAICASPPRIISELHRTTIRVGCGAAAVQTVQSVLITRAVRLLVRRVCSSDDVTPATSQQRLLIRNRKHTRHGRLAFLVCRSRRRRRNPSRRGVCASGTDESRCGYAQPAGPSRARLNFRKRSSAASRLVQVCVVSVQKVVLQRASAVLHSRGRKRWQSQRNVARGELAARPVSLTRGQGRIWTGPFPFPYVLSCWSFLTPRWIKKIAIFFVVAITSIGSRVASYRKREHRSPIVTHMRIPANTVSIESGNIYRWMLREWHCTNCAAEGKD